MISKGLGEPISAIIAGGVALTSLIVRNVKETNDKLRATNASKQLILDTLLEQNRQIDNQIEQLKQSIRQLGLSGLGGLGRFCIFNCKKKKIAATLATIEAAIKVAETEQREKTLIMQNLSLKLDAAQNRGTFVDKNGAVLDFRAGGTSQASIIGWGFTGIVLASLVGGYYWNEKKQKKKGTKKPVKKKNIKK